MENKLKFYNICIEGPDCSGKTTLYNKIHRLTDFKYNIQDRSFLSMYIHSKFYGRDDASFWYDKLFDDLKKLDTLYVIVVPKKEVLLSRLLKRGDEFQNKDSIVTLRDMFFDIAKFRLTFLPNVIFTELDDTDRIASIVNDHIDFLNKTTGGDLIRSFVMNSFQNEVTDISCSDEVTLSSLDEDVLNFPQEKDYYDKIMSTYIRSISRKLIGLGEDKPQKLDSRRFIYTDDSCISMIHTIFRKNALNVSATLRSSNISTTLWADYEFLKILSYYIAEELGVENLPIKLTVNIRSAHIVP